MEERKITNTQSKQSAKFHELSKKEIEAQHKFSLVDQCKAMKLPINRLDVIRRFGGIDFVVSQQKKRA